MLECLVFGRRAAKYINTQEISPVHEIPDLSSVPARANTPLDYAKLKMTVKTYMSDYCGALRTEKGLKSAHEKVSEILHSLKSSYDDSSAYLETLNIATVAKSIIKAALHRPESIGSHYVESSTLMEESNEL